MRPVHTGVIMTTQPERYLIAVATYRRPAELTRLLDSLTASVDTGSVEILIVDNDPDARALPVAGSHPLRPRYVVEQSPGIASARNRALDFFSADMEAMLILDDDEWVEKDWFGIITNYARVTDADVVQGPVVTVYPDEVPMWIRKGGFLQRQIPSSGTLRDTAATNNVLITREAWVRAGCPRFDPAFSTTGGSDWDFFWGVRKAGNRILFCDSAIAFEDVPSSRLSWKWLRRRYTRNGIVIARSRRKHGEPVLPLLVNTTGAFVVGTAQLVVDLLTGKGPRAIPVERILRSFGVIIGLAGYRIHEYHR